MFPYQHFHPNAFEVLTCVAGAAEILFGGPAGETIGIGVGDVALLPPGTGHCQIAARDGFAVCGAYPTGQGDYETIRGERDPGAEVRARIAAVPPPAHRPALRCRGADPRRGRSGPSALVGSAASRSPSPRKLNASTTMMIGTTGSISQG